MGEQIDADDSKRKQPDSKIGLSTSKPRNLSSPSFRSAKLVLFMLALSTAFAGCSSYTTDGNSVRADKISISPSPIPSDSARNDLAKSSDTSSPTGTAGQAKEPESLRWKLGTYVLNGYINAQGLGEPTRDDLDAIAGEICSDLRAGGDGKFYHPEFVPSDEPLIEWATALNYVYATSAECDLSSDYTIGNNLREAILDMVANGDEFSDSYKAKLVAPNYSSPSSSYYSGTVMCNDGTISNAGGTQGACSWHGGVSD